MNCLDVREQVGCLKHADGSQENITIVREYGEGANGVVLVRTHFINASGDHITLAAGDSITPGNCTICCGSVLVTNLNATGNTIATITTAEGQAFDIKETVTTFSADYNSTTGVKIGQYTSEDGTITEVFAPKQNVVKMETETFTATAGQTAFTLTYAPQGDVRFSRNGATLADTAATEAQTVTYLQANNNNQPMLAGDRVDISYIYYA